MCYREEFMNKNSCLMCRKPQDNGIIIYGVNICRECELRLINVDVDTDFYEYYKDKIKKSIVSVILRGDEHNWQNYRL